MIEAITLGIKLFGIFFSCIACHELAHYFYFKRKLKKNIHIRLRYKPILKIWFTAGKKEDYENLTDQQYIAVNFWGVAAGFLPIFIAASFNDFYFFMALPYIWGIIPDVANITRTLSTTKEQIFEDDWP